MEISFSQSKKKKRKKIIKTHHKEDGFISFIKRAKTFHKQAEWWR